MEFGCTAGFSNFIDGPDGVISTGLRLGVVEAKDTDALITALHSDVLGRVDGFVVLVPLNLRGGFPLDHTVQFWGAQKKREVFMSQCLCFYQKFAWKKKVPEKRLSWGILHKHWH